MLSLRESPTLRARKDGALTPRDSEPEPDLAIVAGTHEDFFHAHPTTAALAIEVAVTNPHDDRALAEIYAEAGVGEYWVVLPKERAIEVFRQPEGLAYRVGRFAKKWIREARDFRITPRRTGRSLLPEGRA